MSQYILYGVTLSKHQMEEIAKAYRTKSPISIQLKHADLSGHSKIPLTQTQINSIQKAKDKNSGVRLKITKTQIVKFKDAVTKDVKTGGFIPLVIAALGALGALSGGAAGIASAVQEKKHQQNLEKMMQKELAATKQPQKQIKLGGFKSHVGKGMRLGKGINIEHKADGLYLKPYGGAGMFLSK